MDQKQIEDKPAKPIVIDYKNMTLDEITRIMYYVLKPGDTVKVIGHKGDLITEGVFVNRIHDSITIEVEKDEIKGDK